MDKKRFKEWLEKEAGKENLKIKIRFIKDEYTPRAKKDGTITIPDCTFDKTFKSDEQKAVGFHEIAHLKYRHIKIEENWRNKKLLLFLVLAALPTIPLALGLYLLGFDSRLYTIVIIGVLSTVAVKFLRNVLPQYFHLKRLHELEADKYTKERMGSTAPMISYLEKGERFKEKWRKKLTWRVAVWYGDKTHPSKSERIERLKRMS